MSDVQPATWDKTPLLFMPKMGCLAFATNTDGAPLAGGLASLKHAWD